MCLDKRGIRPSPTKEGIGYKLFNKYRGKLFPMYFNFGHRIPTKKWINCIEIGFDNRKDNINSEGKKYKNGFHIFKFYKDAENRHLARKVIWYDEVVMRRVKFRKAHTEGTDRGNPCIVAHEIYVYPGEVK